ncbi:MAG: alpha/beta fold hydrolase [Thermoplasmata archaeon]|nr:alpha/beta hydrolase [Thermoplasmata archaeon]
MERKFAETRFGKISYLFRKGEYPIIALHGIGSSAESFAKLEKYLDNKFGLYFIDLLGHGRSPKIDIEYTIENQCIFLNDFIKGILPEEFTLMGNSYGGWVSLRFSVYFYNPKNLVLVDSAGLQPPVGTMPEEYINNFIDFLVKSNNRNDAKILKNMIMNNQDPKWRMKPEELHKIKSNTLIIWGKNDDIIDIKYAELFNSYIKNSKLFIMDAGHMPQLEKPEEFAKIINNNL